MYSSTRERPSAFPSRSSASSRGVSTPCASRYCVARRRTSPTVTGRSPLPAGGAGLRGDLTPLAARCDAGGACPCPVALSCAPPACLLCQRRPSDRGSDGGGFERPSALLGRERLRQLLEFAVEHRVEAV